MDGRQEPRYEQRGRDKDERPRPKSDLFPNLFQMPIVRI